MPRVVPDRLAQEPHEGRSSWTLKVLSCFADSPPGWDPDRRRLGPYPCLRMIHPARRSNIRSRRVVFQLWELEAHHGARIARPISDRRAAIPGAKSGTGSVQCSEAALIAVNTRRQGGSKTKHLG